MAAAYLARKAISTAWTKVTGREPPSHPEIRRSRSPKRSAGPILTGVGVEAARLLATRAASRRMHPAAIEAEADGR